MRMKVGGYVRCVWMAALMAMLVAGRVATAAVQATAANWADAAKYEFGQSRTNVAVIEEEIRATPVKKYPAMEEKLLALLKTPGVTYDAKDFVCRMLRIVGSEKCLPAMGELIADEKTSHIGRYAVEGLPFPAVDELLRNALEKTKGPQKIGVIGSIAVRGDRKAVSLLKPLVTEGDAAVGAAAIGALGRIGGADALQALTDAKVADGLKCAVMEARLLCADGLLGKGEAEKAVAIYRELQGEGNPRGIRAAAITGLAVAENEKALPAVLSMLKSSEGYCQRAAGKALASINIDKSVKAVVAELPVLSPDAQVIVINVLVAGGAKSTVGDIAKLAAGTNETVRIAAVQAMAALGDSAYVEQLAAIVKEGGEVGKAAVEALARLKGPGVSESILKTLANVDSASKALLIASLAERQNPVVVPDLVKYVDDADEAVKVEALKSLGALMGEKEIPSLIGLMLKAKPGRVQTTGEQAVQAACARLRGEEKRVAPIVAALKSAGVEERAVLLHCLGRLGGEKALGIVREEVKSKDEKVQEAAVRALVDWTDEGAIPDLVELAKSAPKENLKILAFRGYVRLVSLPANVKKNAGKTAKTLVEAMKLAMRPDEKKLVLGALGGISDWTALEAAQKCIQDDSLKMEAELACIKIAQSFRPGKTRDKAMAVVKKIAESSGTESIRKQAESVLGRKK